LCRIIFPGQFSTIMRSRQSHHWCPPKGKYDLLTFTPRFIIWLEKKREDNIYKYLKKFQSTLHWLLEWFH
jgi:hypothetical protein